MEEERKQQKIEVDEMIFCDKNNALNRKNFKRDWDWMNGSFKEAIQWFKLFLIFFFV